MGRFERKFGHRIAATISELHVIDESVEGLISSVGLIVPTLNGGSRWQEAVRAITTQSVAFKRKLVVDSESTDDTAKTALLAGFEVMTIKRSEFNHGGTRQFAAEYLSDCQILVFLTQDAVLADQGSVASIVTAFADPQVAVAYGRQLPHPGATEIEAHGRIFNYGPADCKKDLSARRELGSRVFFCSNSFAAYRRSALLELGGFRGDLILGEDMEFAARAIRAGHSNLYRAEACVYHSHDYSFLQTFSRYFDIGVFDAGNGWMRNEFGSHRGQGQRFVKSELTYLSNTKPSAIPRSLLHTAAKFAGYRLGRVHEMIPVPVKRKLSMMPGFWTRAS